MKTLYTHNAHIDSTKYATACSADNRKKSFALIGIIIALIIACTLLLINVQANADANGANGEQSNEPSVTAEASWDTVGAIVKEGTDATLTITAKSDEEKITSTAADVLYIADWGCNGDEGYLDLINQSIERIKDQNSDSRFGFIGFSEGISKSSEGFSSEFTLSSFTYGTYSDWSVGFNKAKEMIDARTGDDLNQVEIIFLTNHNDATKNVDKVQESFDALNGKYASFKIVSPNNAASTSVLKEKVDSSNLYDGSSLNMVKDEILSEKYKDYSQPLSKALVQANSDRVNKPITNVTISTPLATGFEIKGAGNIDSIYINGCQINNEQDINNLKLTSSKLPSGKTFKITANLSFNGTRDTSINCSGSTKFSFTPTGGTEQTKNANSTTVSMTEYSVFYNSDGGTGQDEPVDSKKYFKGDTVYAKDGSLLVKEDGNFGGWEASSSTNDHQTIGTNGTQFVMGSSDLTLTAQYSKLFVYNSGNIAADPTLIVKNDNDGGIILHESISKRDVAKIVFTDTIDTATATYTWAASQDGTNGVTGWAIANSSGSEGANDETYTVYYGCKGVYPRFPTNCSWMFKSFSQLTQIIGLEHIVTTDVENMAGMFSSCSGLTSLDLSHFDTSKVTDMRYMFHNCYGLTSLDVSGFDTSNVESIAQMFYWCHDLTSLNVSNFNTSKVKDVNGMYQMFYGCFSLNSLDVSNFDTSNVQVMTGMFEGCYGLTSLDVSNFDTSNVQYMDSMFSNCYGLTSLDVSNFDTSKVKRMNNMFYKCSGLISLDVSNFDTSNVQYMGSMFYECSGLTGLDISNFNTFSVLGMNNMFYGCKGLTSLDLSSFKTSSVKDMSCMFYGCAGLISLNISKFDTSSVQKMNGMFYSCSSLTSLDLSSFDTSIVAQMIQMFKGCSSLKALDLSSFVFADTIMMTKMMEDAFSKCTPEDKGTVKIRKDMYQTFYDNSGISTQVEAQKVIIEQVDPTYQQETPTQNLNTNNVSESNLPADEDDKSTSCDDALRVDNTVEDKPSAQKAYADEINDSVEPNELIPSKYKDTVYAGTFTNNMKTISFSLKAMNYGKLGTSGRIDVSDNIPAGLTVVDGTILAKSVARINPDGGALNGKVVKQPTLEENGSKLTFAVEGLSAGAQIEVVFDCQLDNVPTEYTQYVNSANYTTQLCSGASNYAIADTVGTKPDTYTNTFVNEAAAGSNVPQNAPTYNTLSYAAGATVTLPDLPNVAGYTSEGWDVKDKDGNTIEVTNNTFIMPDSDVTSTVTWTKVADPTKYNVSYKYEGDYPSTAENLLPSDDNFLKGVSVAVPTIAEDEISGWRFKGWTAKTTTSKDTNDVIDITNGTFIMPEDNVEVTGTWEKDKYVISLEKGSGPADGDVSLPTGYPKDATWGDTCDWPEDAEFIGTTGTKYKFSEWSVSPTLTSESGQFTMPMQNVTFTGIWTPVNTCTVTYDTNGHGTAPSPQSVDEGATTTKPADPIATGYTFGGWYKESACTNEWDFDTDKVKGDTTLYAKWTANSYAVKFDGNKPSAASGDIEGTMPSEPMIYDTEKALTTNAYTLTGWTFAGWNTQADGKGTSYTDGQLVKNLTSTAGEEITLYAQWTANNVVGPSGDNSSDESSIATGSGASSTGDSTPFVLWALIACVAGVISTSVCSLWVRRNSVRYVTTHEK